MKIKTNEIKSIYRTYIDRNSNVSREDCPSVDEIINLLRSELSRRKKKRLLNHIQECPFCIKEVQAIIQILKEENKFINQTSELPRFKKSRIKTKKAVSLLFCFSWKQISAFALSLLFIFAVSLSLHKILNKQKYRGSSQAAIKIVKPHKRIIIYENDIRFKWNHIPENKFYKAVLFDESLYPIWESERLTNNSVKLPFEVYKGMKHKTTYFLLVTSHLNNGKKIESQFKEFRVFIKHSKK